jgi:hypothetical protein
MWRSQVGLSGQPAATGRREALALAAATAILLLAPDTRAQVPPVAVEVQASLLAKVVSYDRNFAARAIDRAKCLLVFRAADPVSVRVVQNMSRALESIPAVGGLPHNEEVEPFTDAPALARTCISHRISIMYLGPGLSSEVPAIRTALNSLDVLSVAANPDDVPRGIVLGFNMVAGNPKLLLHLGQARAQNVRFGARLLRRMTIFD